MPGDRLLHFTRGGRNRGRGIVAIVVMFRIIARCKFAQLCTNCVARLFFFFLDTWSVFVSYLLMFVLIILRSTYLVRISFAAGLGRDGKKNINNKLCVMEVGGAVTRIRRFAYG